MVRVLVQRKLDQCCPTNMDEVWVWTESCRMIGFHNKANAGKEIQTHGAQ